MRLHTDASREEDVIGIAYVLRDEMRGIDVRGKQYIHGEFTSMQAEWHALMFGIHAASWYDCDTLLVQTDCKPLAHKMKVRQEREQWENRRVDCTELLDTFNTWKINHIPREQNTEADRLAREALWFGKEDIQCGE